AMTLLEERSFDLLLLDLHMPKLDGFKVIRGIRERERMTGAHLPVIALTARSGAADRERCLAAGMDEFLAKPIDTGTVFATIDRVIARVTSTRPPEAGLLTPRLLFAACGEDPAILERICIALTAELPRSLSAVEQALREGDRQRLRESTHRLGGMLSAL